jgi:hypothetical protein
MPGRWRAADPHGPAAARRLRLTSDGGPYLTPGARMLANLITLAIAMLAGAALDLGTHGVAVLAFGLLMGL